MNALSSSGRIISISLTAKDRPNENINRNRCIKRKLCNTDAKSTSGTEGHEGVGVAALGVGGVEPLGVELCGLGPVLLIVMDSQDESRNDVLIMSP